MTEKKEKTVKNQCYSCAYRKTIPGDAHSKCSFDFEKANIKMPAGNPHGIRSGWYMFPYNYDPTWMIEKCEAWSKTADKELQTEGDSIGDLMAIFGKRFF